MFGPTNRDEGIFRPATVQEQQEQYDWMPDGFSQEFIKVCCEEFKPGEMVTFIVEIPDAAVGPGRIDWVNT